MVRYLRLWIPLLILAFVIKFVDKDFYESYNFHLTPIILLAIIIYWVTLRQIEKRAEKKDFIAKGIDPNKFIYGSTYLIGLPSILSPISVVLFYPTEKELNIYNGSRAYKKVLVETLLKSSIKNIFIENITDVNKRMTKEDLNKLLSLSRSTKNSNLNNLSFLIIEWEKNSLLQSTIFAFGTKKTLETNFQEASFALNTLTQYIA